MAERIEQIIYISRATRPATRRDLDRIGRLASENNATLGVTGVLIYARGVFLQMLEGDPRTLNALMESKILPDRRHEDVRVLYRAPAEERLAASWAMNVLKVEDLAFQISQVRFIELIDELVDAARGEADESLPARLVYAFERVVADPALVG